MFQKRAFPCLTSTEQKSAIVFYIADNVKNTFNHHIVFVLNRFGFLRKIRSGTSDFLEKSEVKVRIFLGLTK